MGEPQAVRFVGHWGPAAPRLGLFGRTGYAAVMVRTVSKRIRRANRWRARVQRVWKGGSKRYGWSVKRPARSIVRGGVGMARDYYTVRNAFRSAGKFAKGGAKAIYHGRQGWRALRRPVMNRVRSSTRGRTAAFRRRQMSRFIKY